MSRKINYTCFTKTFNPIILITIKIIDISCKRVNFLFNNKTPNIEFPVMPNAAHIT